MNIRQRTLKLTSAIALVITLLFPIGSFAATSGDDGGCPPIICSNIATPNLLHNPSFEILGPNGSPTWHSGPIPYPFPTSAAAGWSVHNDNFGSFISTELVPSHRPGGGARMIHVTTGGTEGGIVQAMSGRIGSIVASVWVFTVSGYVVMQTSAGSDGPFAKTTTTGQWELLQIYNDSSTPVNWFVLYNQAAGGGEFYADLACVTRWKTDYSYFPGQSKPEFVLGTLNGQGVETALGAGYITNLKSAGISDVAVSERGEKSLIADRYTSLFPLSADQESKNWTEHQGRASAIQ